MLWNKIKAAITHMSTLQLVMVPFLCSLVPLGLLILISPGHYSGTMAEKILIELMVFLWGLSGIPVIIRRELPYLIPIRGWYAVVTGIFMIFISWFVIIVANLPSK